MVSISVRILPSSLPYLFSPFALLEGGFSQPVMLIYAVPAAKHTEHKSHPENPQEMFPTEKELARDTHDAC